MSSEKRRRESNPAYSKRVRTAAGSSTTTAGSKGSSSRKQRSSVITFNDRPGNRLGFQKLNVKTEVGTVGSPTQPHLDPQVGPSDLVEPLPIKDGSDNVPADSESQHTAGGALEEEIQKKKRVRNFKNWTKLAEWLPHRTTFLEELLRHDGLGDYFGKTQCSMCDENGCILFKCRDCWNGSLLVCRECTLSIHGMLPFHRIEQWNGSFFVKSSLFELGLRFQLGHGGDKCPEPVPAPKDFLVFDTSGIHRISLDYCGCQPGFLAIDKKLQLLRSRLFPATLSRPQTAFTFEILDHYHQLSLQGKVTIYDFYNSLLHSSDNLKLDSIPSRSNDFHRAFRLWRVLLMLKRGGRGHVPNGIESTAQGELALECPACPHPGKNLPDNWEQANSMMFLYTLFLAVDANFKLKGKDRGIHDIELMPGWAYFVEEKAYQEHLVAHVDESEINTCLSEHDAVVRAAVRCTPGYNVTGAGLVICSRHGLVRPNGAGDLQKGERYCNMDYILVASFFWVTLVRVIVTYDIACQWIKNFHKRLERLPSTIQLDTARTSVKALIPSWHINAHGPDCQTNFALTYTEGAAHTCGDEIESGWHPTNVLGASVREMAPGARHEILNDQWHGSNFRKMVRLRKRQFLLVFGTLLPKKFRDAALMRRQHEEAFTKLTLTFTPERIAKWTRMIVAWDDDPTNNPNPYQEVKLETTMQDIRLELAKEDADEAARGVVSVHQTSMTACLVIGLELEEQQCSLKYDLETSKLTTSKQKADLEEKRTGLRRRIQRWREVQATYSPCILPLIKLTTIDSDADVPDALNPEDLPLHLPSSLSVALRRTIPTMADRERRLREAQADDALADIRLGRRVLTGLTTFKKLNLAGAGNKPNTRVRSLYNRIQTKITKAANRYRRAREALQALNPGGAWEQRLLPLNSGDIRGPGKGPEEASNRRYVPSWIWQVPRVRSEGDKALAEDELDESLRVEWAKARARHRRWEEEYWLVQEEMRRTIVYLHWKAEWWRQRANSEPFRPSDVMDGLRAYGMKQAEFCVRLAERCSAAWIPVLRKHGELPQWKPWAATDVHTSQGFPEGGTIKQDGLVNEESDENESQDEDEDEDEDEAFGDNMEDKFEFEIDD